MAEPLHNKLFVSYLTDGTPPRALSTALHYDSIVRRMFSYFDGMPSEGALLNYDAEIPSSHRGQFRAAWRAFVAFMKAHGKPVTDPVFPNHTGMGRVSKLDPYAKTLGPLLMALVKYIQLRHIEAATLRQASAAGRGGGFFVPALGQTISVPPTLINKIIEWGYPSRAAPPSAIPPFIPIEPDMFYKRMPIVRMERIIARAAQAGVDAWTEKPTPPANLFDEYKG